MKSTNQKKVIAAVLIGCLGVSTSAIFGKLTTADGVVSAFFRMFFTSLLLLPVVLIRKREELKAVSRKDLLISILSGIFLGFHFATYLTSLQYTSVASCLILVDMDAVFVALASFFLFRERFSAKSVPAILLAVAGSIVIALSDRTAGGSNVLFGDLLALAGGLFIAVYTLIGTKQRSHLSTTVYTFIVYTAAAVTLFFLCLILKKPFTGYPATDYLCCLGMAVFCTLLGHSMFNYALAYVSPAFVSTAKLSEPVLSSIAAAFLFGQYPSALQIIGGVLVITGIAWYILKGIRFERS